jgi:adenine/guanine phosphoribosyltransferase-like PRPP-binding protein
MSQPSLLPPVSLQPFSDRQPAPGDLGWVAAELGLTVQLDNGAPVDQLDVLAGLALRRNPRRAHLLVSRVLGKHLPVDPKVALDAAGRLAAAVLAHTATPSAGFLVFGFAETATALAQAVAAALPGATCVLSTRRPGVSTISFAEEHSHATDHRVLAPAALLNAPRTVVLVDDELSSGRTAVNTIRALHREAPHPGYVVAALLDLRPAASRREFQKLAAELGVPVEAVSLVSGQLHVPADAPTRVAPVVAAADPAQQLTVRWPPNFVDAGWPSSVRLCAREGWDVADETALGIWVGELAERLLTKDIPEYAGRLLVLGTEELMYAPMKLAAALGERLAGTGRQVRYQSTTRSPVAPIDREGYAVRCALEFAAPDEPERTSFVYNVRPGIADHIIVVTDGGRTAPMVAALSGCAAVSEVLLRNEVNRAVA